jgi:nitroreductase
MYKINAKKLKGINMLDLLWKRRSIREYTNKIVESEKLEKLIQAALLSPTSRNKRPWEFVVVDRPETLSKLSSAKEHGSAFLSGASVAIVILANTRISDVWVEDCSIAAIDIQLTAESIGLGSCWIQIRERSHNSRVTAGEYVKTILNIPEYFAVEAIIAVGYPKQQRPPYESSDFKYEKVHINSFGNKYRSES